MPTEWPCRAEFYIVTDEVWAASAMTPTGGCLCVGCLEARLGRQLTPADFPDLPVNDLTITDDRYAWSFRTPRLIARLSGQPGSGRAQPNNPPPERKPTMTDLQTRCFGCGHDCNPDQCGYCWDYCVTCTEDLHRRAHEMIQNPKPLRDFLQVDGWSDAAHERCDSVMHCDDDGDVLMGGRDRHPQRSGTTVRI